MAARSQQRAEPGWLRARRWLGRSCLLCLCLWLVFLPGTVYADGGAPNLAYVAGGASGIGVIDIVRRQPGKAIALAGDPSSVLLSADGSTLYAAQPVQGSVVVLNAASGKIHCKAELPGRPSLLALSPQGDVLYAAGEGDSHVRVLNAQTCALQHTFQVPGAVSGLTITLIGGAFPKHTGLYQFWTATADGLTAFDTDGSVLEHFALPQAQHFAAPLGFAIYVTTGQGTLVAVDLVSHKVTPPLLHSSALGTIDYNQATGEIYAPDQQAQQILVLAPITPGQPLSEGKIVQRIAVQGVPESIAITSDGQFGFVALQDGHVAMLDIPGRRTVTTFMVGGHPHFIITGLYPPEPAAPPPSQQPAPAVSPLRNPLLVLFIALFGFSLLALLGLLVLWWRKRED